MPPPSIENQVRMLLKCHLLHWTIHSLHSNLIRHTNRKFLHMNVNLIFHELHLRLLLDMGLYGDKIVANYLVMNDVEIFCWLRQIYRAWQPRQRGLGKQDKVLTATQTTSPKQPRHLLSNCSLLLNCFRTALVEWMIPHFLFASSDAGLERGMRRLCALRRLLMITNFVYDGCTQDSPRA